jgi:ATP-dependent DNA helicase RecG
VFGERQSGMSDLKLGRLPRDEPVVVDAREVAERILAADPTLAAHASLRHEFEDLYPDDAADYLFKS